MGWQTFASVFATVLLAEIGDKTQLATMLFAADAKSAKWWVFAGSASALVLAAGIGVVVGAGLERLVSSRALKIAAGIGFIAVGVWTLLSK